MQQKIHIYAGKYNIRSSLPEPTYRKGTTHNKKRETRPRLNFLLLKTGAGYHPLLPVKRLPNFLRVSSYQPPFLSARFLAANIHLVLSTTTNYAPSFDGVVRMTWYHYCIPGYSAVCCRVPYRPGWRSVSLSFYRVPIVYRIIETIIEIPSFLRFGSFFFNRTIYRKFRYDINTTQDTRPLPFTPKENWQNWQQGSWKFGIYI